MTAIPTRRRGVTFEAEPPRPAAALPRLDVAAFVGLAAAGPLDTPVPIEDTAAFRELFGAEVPLAWDAENGGLGHAYLGPAVAAFFGNGGRRCWVVRVAGDAATARFPLPGLAPASALGDPAAAVAEARARSAGSWAEALRVGTVLHRTTLPLVSPDLDFAAAGATYGVEVSAGAGEVRRGDLLEIVFAAAAPVLFLHVGQVTPRERGVRLVGPGFLAGAGVPAAPAAVRRLDFEILVWHGDELQGRLGGLAFSPDHPRYWARLPADDELFPARDGRAAPAPQPELEDLTRAAREPRFALAGPADAAARGALYLPLGMGSVPDPALASGAIVRGDATALERDGLADYGAHLFLDPDLAGYSAQSLLAEAHHKHSVLRQRPRGIHSLLAVDEVTLLAVPDAVHRGWSRTPVPPPEPAPAPPPEDAESTGAPAPDFRECAPPAPAGDPEADAEEHGTPGVAWTATAPEAFDDSHLLAAHRAVLRFCAARGDLLALLSLPGHYRERETLDHLAALAPAAAAPPAHGVPPLTYGEQRVLSFGALYHPWLGARIESRGAAAAGLTFAPPEGAACGVTAALTAAEGAWVAPANRPLKGVLAVRPALSPAAEERLLAAGANVIRHDPRGFLTLGAATLSGEREVRPIPVRRTLVLLGRLALAEGLRYVFEPHDADFRRLVRRRFERLLADLYTRGALAGRTPDEAFRVVTGEELNTAASVEAGRFFVELRVAPSRPLSFLTVRLVQSSPELLALREV